MCQFPRFDLGESAYSLPLYSEATPAWREVYTRIARELVERHMQFWAVVDGMTLVGEDPNVDRYPPEYLVFIPERLRGAYPPPGWVGNGMAPWGLNSDPLSGDGNLFVRGFFNLLLSVYSHVSGDDLYHEPFQVSGYLDRTFMWTHPAMAQFISEQLQARPEGPHCENTKIWPFCVSATGLGLRAFDAVNGTALHTPFEGWLEFAKRNYMGLNRRGELDWFALYYDPVEREACTFPDHLTSLASLCITPYIYPQDREWGQWLYEVSVNKLGWSDPRAKFNQFHPDPRFVSIALLMAHDLGDEVTENRLRAHVEDNFEPKTFGDDNEQFGFFFGWGERYPRGQQSALLMLPEIGGQGAWSGWSGEADMAKFQAPTVEGVDYPAIGLAVARNDIDRGELLLRTYTATPSRRGEATSFTVTQLSDPSAVRITCDGEDFTAWRTIGADCIQIDTTIGEHTLLVLTGYHGTNGPVRLRRVAPRSPMVNRASTIPSAVLSPRAGSAGCC
jgi:hypothetical protein